jgi:hypothetical protein
MTWTAAADAVVPGCARAAAACPPASDIVTDRIAITAATRLFLREPVQHTTCGFAGVLVASPGPGAAPTAARGPGRHPGRPECARPPRPRDLVGLPRQREPGCVRRLHLLGADLATPGWPPDPGREVL